MTRLRYSSRAWSLFDLLFRPRMKMGVRGIRMAGLPAELPRDRPLLLVANHMSWWDGFLMRPLQRALRPEDAFLTVMLEKELRLRPFLRLLGGIGLDPGSLASFRALLRFLEKERSESSRISVLYFPQGRIWPTHRRPLGFKGGVRLVARALAPVCALPVGLHLEAGNHPAPGAFLSVGSPRLIHDDELEPSEMEGAVEEELDAILDFLARHGEDVDEAWPTPGEPLPRSNRGVMQGR